MELATNFCPKFLMIKSQHLSRKMTKGWGSNYDTDTRSEILNMANNLYIYLTVDNTIKKEEVEKKKKKSIYLFCHFKTQSPTRNIMSLLATNQKRYCQELMSKRMIKHNKKFIPHSNMQFLGINSALKDRRQDHIRTKSLKQRVWKKLF